MKNVDNDLPPQFDPGDDKDKARMDGLFELGRLNYLSFAKDSTFYASIDGGETIYRKGESGVYYRMDG